VLLGWVLGMGGCWRGWSDGGGYGLGGVGVWWVRGCGMGRNGRGCVWVLGGVFFYLFVLWVVGVLGVLGCAVVWFARVVLWCWWIGFGLVVGFGVGGVVGWLGWVGLVGRVGGVIVGVSVVGVVWCCCLFFLGGERRHGFRVGVVGGGGLGVFGVVLGNLVVGGFLGVWGLVDLVVWSWLFVD